MYSGGYTKGNFAVVRKHIEAGVTAVKKVKREKSDEFNNKYGAYFYKHVAKEEDEADVNALTADGLTPVDIACACGHAEVVVALVDELGAQVPPLDGGALTCLPLACAAMSGDAECVRALASGAVVPKDVNSELAAAASMLHGDAVGGAMAFA